ncbi:MAG: hypothetical protein QM784_20920 [Polyangiaceae bacterium]
MRAFQIVGVVLLGGFCGCKSSPEASPQEPSSTSTTSAVSPATASVAPSATTFESDL